MGESRVFSNPIVNLTGSIPAASQGAFADLPATGITGQWYLALDTQTLYEWNGAAWVIALNGGGGTFDFNYPFGPVNTVTVSTVLATTKNIYFCNNAPAITLTLPVVGLVTGKVYTIKRQVTSTGIVTIVGAAGTIDGLASYEIDMPGGMVQFCWNGATWQSITYALAVNASALKHTFFNAAGPNLIPVNPYVNVVLVDSFAGAMSIVLQGTGDYIGHIYNIKKIAGAPAVTLTCGVGFRIDSFGTPAIPIAINQNIQVYYAGGTNYYIL